jgi:sulfate adenylyltransferase subunit 1
MNLGLEQNRRLVQVNTAGSVDNGKSTLIGRLLYDSGGFALDKIERVAKLSQQQSGRDGLNFALFTDGLKQEQARGITIDVARHYFARDKLDLIIADTPGHLEFTRNTATGISTSQATLVLVDAIEGIAPQNKRHAYIASLLGVRQIAVLVNKMDLVGYSEKHFERLRTEFDSFLAKLPGLEVQYIPISALNGDNVVIESAQTAWYAGPTVLQYIEELDQDIATKNSSPLRFVLQQDGSKSLAKQKRVTNVVGKVISGSLQLGEVVTLFPSAEQTQVERIQSLSGEADSLRTEQIARVQFSGIETQARRGDLLAKYSQGPLVTKSLTADLCWFDEQALILGREYLLKINSKLTRAVVMAIDHQIDLQRYEPVAASEGLAQNEIARVQIQTADSIAVDSFDSCAANARFILIDPETYNTAGAGVSAF